MDLSKETFEGLLEQIHKSGLPCEACNNFFPASVRVMGEEAFAIVKTVSVFQLKFDRI